MAQGSRPSQAPRGQARIQRLRRTLIEPLFDALPELLPPSGKPIPPIVERNRKERAQQRLAEALASRGTDFVPDELKVEVELLVQAWAVQRFADGFLDVEEFEIACAMELDLDGRVVAIVEDPTPVEPVAAPAERAYRQSVLDRLGSLPLHGIPGVLLQQPLQFGYAPLYVAIEGPSGWQDQLATPALFQKLGNTLLLGEAGSGKSTLLRYLAASTASSGLGPSPPLGELMPFFVPIRYLAAPTLTLETLATSAGCDKDFLLRVLAARRALLLIDGLDQCHPDYATKLLASLAELCAAHPGNVLVCAARPGDLVDQGRRDGVLAGFSFCEVMPLGDEESSLLIERWYLGVEQSILGQNLNVGTKEQLDQAVEQARYAAALLSTWLPTQPYVARMAKSPILCTLLCAVHRQQGKRLPESVSEVYRYCIDHLIHARANTTEGASALPYLKALGPQIVWTLLADLASFMHRARASALPLEWIGQRLGTALRQVGRPPQEAQILLHEFCNQGALLCERTPRMISFCHPTFQQHLTAIGWVQAAKYDLRAATVRDPWWQEVIVHTCTLATKEAARVISTLLEADAASAGAGAKVAARCMEAVPDLPESLRAEVEVRLRTTR